MGADAIGFIFYPKSQRYISPENARKIIEKLPKDTFSVGVFVNKKNKNILEIAEKCKLKAVQLHGNEKPEAINDLRKTGIKVIKVLFNNRKPFFTDADKYEADAILAESFRKNECGAAGKAWNWSEIKTIDTKVPVILAGGLDPENVFHAIKSSGVQAVDVCSGVEIKPGIKDPDKLKEFIDNVHKIDAGPGKRGIFR